MKSLFRTPVRTFSNISKKSSGPVMVNDTAFKFLHRCDGAEIDWTVAQPMVTSVHPAIQSYDSQKIGIKDNKYPSLAGESSMIKCAENYFKEQGIACEQNNIVIGSGIFGILNNLYKALQIASSRQEVLIPVPTFGQFYQQCFDAAIRTQFLTTKKEDNWQIKPEILDDQLSQNPNIRILLTNFPNNPTGAVITKRNAESIAEVLKSYPDVLVVCDEILRDIPLNPDPIKQHFSFALVPELRDRTVILNSAAKSRGLAGFNVGFAYFPTNIAELYREHRNMVMPKPSDQEMVANLLADNLENREYLQKNIFEYHKNIAHLQEQIAVLNQKLREHFGDGKNVVYVKLYTDNIEAGNTALLDFSGLKNKHLVGGRALSTGLSVAEFLLEKADIGIVPGECFFIPKNEMVVRIPTSTPQTEIELGFKKIGQVMIENLKNPPKVKVNVGSCEEKSR